MGVKSAPGWIIPKVSAIPDLDDLEGEIWDSLSWSFLDEILDLELMLKCVKTFRVLVKCEYIFLTGRM